MKVFTAFDLMLSAPFDLPLEGALRMAVLRPRVLRLLVNAIPIFLLGPVGFFLGFMLAGQLGDTWEKVFIWAFVLFVFGGPVWLLRTGGKMQAVTLKDGMVSVARQGLWKRVSFAEPLANYLGLSHRPIVFHGVFAAFPLQIIELVHVDGDKTVILSLEPSATGRREKIRAYAEALGLPVVHASEGRFVLEGSVDENIGPVGSDVPEETVTVLGLRQRRLARLAAGVLGLGFFEAIAAGVVPGMASAVFALALAIPYLLLRDRRLFAETALRVAGGRVELLESRLFGPWVAADGAALSEVVQVTRPRPKSLRIHTDHKTLAVDSGLPAPVVAKLTADLRAAVAAANEKGSPEAPLEAVSLPASGDQ